MAVLKLHEMFGISFIDKTNEFRLEELREAIDKIEDDEIVIDLWRFDIQSSSSDFISIVTNKKTKFIVYNNIEAYKHIKMLLNMCKKPESYVKHVEKNITKEDDSKEKELEAYANKFKSIIEDKGDKTAAIKVARLYSFLSEAKHIEALCMALSGYKSYKKILVDFSGVEVGSSLIKGHIIPKLVQLGNVELYTNDVKTMEYFSTILRVENSGVKSLKDKVDFLNKNFPKYTACLLGTYLSRNFDGSSTDMFGRPGNGVPTSYLPAIYLDNDGVNARFQVFRKEQFRLRLDYREDHGGMERHPGLVPVEKKIPIETLGICGACVGTKHFVNLPVQDGKAGALTYNTLDRATGVVRASRVLLPQYMKMVFDEFGIRYDTTMLLRCISYSKAKCREKGLSFEW